MKWIKKITTRFVEWLRQEYRYRYEDDFPKSFKENIIYIVGDLKRPWLLAFKCPCGCQAVIQLNLLKEASPNWKFKISKWKGISIFPSIWRTMGCKSHFFVRHGRIEWTASRVPSKRTTKEAPENN
jgi:hypothetical protein